MDGGFLAQAFIYLLAAVAAVPIAKRLGLGSVLGYLLAGVVIGPFGLAFGYDWRVALAAGLILAMSSTAIALQILAERGLLRTSGGETAFAVLLFQDVSVIPILTVLPLLALAPAAGGGAGHGDGWIETLPAWAQALAVLGAVAAVVVGGRLLTRPAFRLIAETRLREIFTASALLLVIAVTLL